jgi:hypothetical protein
MSGTREKHAVRGDASRVFLTDCGLWALTSGYAAKPVFTQLRGAHSHAISTKLIADFGFSHASVWLVRGLADVFGFDLIARANAMTLTSLAGVGVALGMPLLVRFGSAKPISLLWLSAGALAASGLVIGPAASSWLGVALISVLFSVGAIHPLVMSQAARSRRRTGWESRWVCRTHWCFWESVWLMRALASLRARDVARI